MTTMTVADLITKNQKYPYPVPKNPGIIPSGKFIFPVPKNPGITPSPQVDEFVKTLPKKDEKTKIEEKVQPKESKTSKKLGVSLASVLYSGLGQAVNGQWGKALGFCVGEGAAMLTGFCVAGPVGALLSALAVKSLSIYDAVKNV